MADNNTMLGMSLIAAGSALVGATAALLLVRKLQVREAGAYRHRPCIPSRRALQPSTLMHMDSESAHVGCGVGVARSNIRYQCCVCSML